MNWISIENALPPLPKNGVCEGYLVCVKKQHRPTRIRFAKWQKKMHRRASNIESINQVLMESHLAKWVVSGYKVNEVTHWMPLPELPKERL